MEEPSNVTREYTAKQLEAFGCSHRSGSRKKAQNRDLHAQKRIDNGVETYFFPYAPLPPIWQAKIDAYENAKRDTRDRATRAAKFAREEADTTRKLQDLELKRAELPLTDADREDLWNQYGKAKTPKKNKALRRNEILLSWRRRVEVEGMTEVAAAKITAQEYAIKSITTLYTWRKKVKSVDRVDQVAVLIGQGAGRKSGFDAENQASNPPFIVYLLQDYLRRPPPTAKSCYRRTVIKAKETGWKIIEYRTVLNWIAKLSPLLVTRMREGPDAVAKLYPSQQRDKTVFHALEGVNGDGYEFDIWVDFGEGVVPYG